MKRVLVTGYSGFVGRRLVAELARAGHQLSLAGRRRIATDGAGAARVTTFDALGPSTDWRAALEGCEAVIHLAAQVPQAGVEAAVFDAVNNRGVERLVADATSAGVKQFIFISSIFAVAEHSSAAPLDESAPPRPATPYGVSKLAGEAHVRRFAEAGGAGVILRPPMIYGDQGSANWLKLMRLAASGAPLPFASVRNRRNFVHADNLVSAIAHLLSRNAEDIRSGTYHIADAEPVSLAETLSLLRGAMGIPARLLPCPPSLIGAALRLLGQGTMAQSLLADFEIDSGLFRRTFGWTAPFSSRDGIAEAGRGFVARRSRAGER